MNQHQRDKQAYMNATPMQREMVRRLLCDVLGCLRAQYLSYQTSHWQVVGQSFYGNHLLFARLYESVQAQVDQLAEKLVGYLGREVVGLDHQIKHIAEYTMRWSQIDCHHKRGLQSEADLQVALKRAYDGIKQVNAMTLGLDDWIMATANSHEENEYLLQQALTPVPGQKQASTNTERYFYKATDGKWYTEDDSGRQRPPRNPVKPGRGRRLWGSGPRLAFNKYNPDDLLAALVDILEKYELDDAVDEVKKITRVVQTAWRGRERTASGAPTAEGNFYDNPEKKEVLEFANTGAISNSPEVAAAAAEEDQLDVPEAKAVAEAEEAPPTPDEIKDEAGGSAVSTLNRFVVETEDPAAEPAVKMNELRERQARLQEAFANWPSVRTARIDKLVFKPGRGVVEWDHAKKTFSVDESDVEKILGELRGQIYLYSTPASKLYRFSLNPARSARYWKYNGPEGLTLLVWK